MMRKFLADQDKKRIEYYKEMLGIIGSLSRLFSDSDEPYIQYRIVENLFCKSFGAKNLSRTDCSVDASKNQLGIGLKTFLEQGGSTMQKIAEFNSEHGLFNGLNTAQKIAKIAGLRNKRLDTTRRIFKLDELIYHCVTRKSNGILVYESPMDAIIVGKINRVDDRGGVVGFSDSLNEYSFNISKSTLYKRFFTKDVLLDLPVKIIGDPFDALERMFKGVAGVISPVSSGAPSGIFLPLYSKKGGERMVPPKSGLNQWNASGRTRDPNEVYIPIPAWIHKKYAGFFPDRDESFTLVLPDGSEMSAKVCQDGSKALMSNPNAALGEWLLRGILDLREGELLTYQKLEEVGFDSVAIHKIGDHRYDIDFTKAGSYEYFKEKNAPTELDEEGV